jgi:preprotein translocase subunit SecD
MQKNLRNKIILILVVVGLAVWAFYPPSTKLNLGLDLKGGIHLVLRVHTDDALRFETEATVERLREALTRAGVQFGKLEATGPTTFGVEGIQNDQAFRQVAVDADAVYDRSSGVASYTYTMKPNVTNQMREGAIAQTLQTIERRVNELGVAEPIVARYGSGEQLIVQLPGVSDVQRAKDIIRSTAVLELKIVEQGPVSTREELLVNGQVPDGRDILPGTSDLGSIGTPGTTVYYLVRRAASITGRDLRNAQPTLDENNQPAVSFTLTADGGRRFGTLTETNIGRQLAIILDGRVQSAPQIQSRITDQGRITGSFTQQEVQDLSLVLRSGALPASTTYLEERTIGPSLGADSIRSGITASLGGLAFVALFMLSYYKLAGINAIVSVGLNLVILLGFMSYIGATMTLPGIAGFILTIGMGVDSNVLIFERIKEELAGGRAVKAAVAAGFDRVWWTIVDTHVSSMIAAGLLFQFGTGPIRGFATTLFFGLLANVFTAVFVSRTLFELILSQRRGAALSI